MCLNVMPKLAGEKYREYYRSQKKKSRTAEISRRQRKGKDRKENGRDKERKAFEKKPFEKKG